MTETHSLQRSALDTLELPPAPQPVGHYVPVLPSGNLVFTSGMIPLRDGKVAYQGHVGGLDLGVAEGREAARLCLLNALSALKAHLGSLERIRRIVKLTVYVSSAPAFYEQPAVANGASELLVELFGESGRHVRSAVGVASLPLNAAVELELTVEI